ncbi:hemolysin secretion protein D [Phenylobacterium sp. Root77]|uniref:efflux RND transporter periplasmic adaptor subunit n=1 Tax=unclassified Phenylobacterium TaxID=2640670 RepID=UPI0006F9C872|nr:MULTISPECIES: efflux RND transporter periplasmic adaptor subunit [unclassified Phenylobacterium]KQW73351.1 hemolysin secretion protein D [Phenylobacterium sp. Root1277]KQW92570.1 hemolysin secretion protein D [Phenylobacterium sp. Root1290]KRC40799.1 hemolysin secretion protein D [Phenylobacterium sp. Root77]
MTRTTTILAIAAGLASAVTLAACGPKEAPKKDEAANARAVRVVRVENRAISGSLTASGSLIPREEAAVNPEVSGYRVSRVLVEEGAQVKAGQTLAQLDGVLINAQVEQQKALAAQAEAQAQQAEAEAGRVAGLDGQGVLSQEAIDQRRFQAKAARATANAQAAAYRDVQTRATKLAVTAPVSGVVLERTVRPGDLASAGGTPWFRIARDGQIELSADLSEDSLARVRVGQAATVTLPSGATAVGRVRIISPQINTQTKLGTVRILLPVRNDIRAGGFGRAVFGDVAGQGLVVPETAIRYDADGASVMTIDAQNRVKRVNVQTGARGEGLVTLVRGPAAGTRVVQNAAAFLLDGDIVKPVEGAQAQPVAAPAAQPAAKAQPADKR